MQEARIDLSTFRKIPWENDVPFFLGDLFDLDAPLLAGHEDRALGGAVDDEPEVELAFDPEPLLDEHALHDLAGGAGLVRDERLAQHRGRGGFGLGGILDDLDAPALAPPAGVDLGLDDNGTAPEPLSCT